MIEWKLFWALTLSAVGAASIALSMTMTGVLFVVIPIVVMVLAVAGVALIGPNVIDSADVFGGLSHQARRRIWVGVLAATVGYAAWVITGVLVPVTWEYILAITVAGLLLPVIVYWAARGMEWSIAHQPAPTAVAVKEEKAEAELLDHRERVLRSALRRAGLRWVKVLPGATQLRSDAGWQFRVRTPSQGSLKKADKAGHQAELTQKAMEPLAIALAEITGRDIESDWVRLRKERGAGLYSITVTSRDVMAEVVPYIDDPSPASLSDPALIGVEIDGREHHCRLDQHQRDVGASTAGKSSLLHLKLAHASRCPDTLIWVAGVQKLYDLVAGWLEPYYGKGLKSPLDWVAHGPEDTLQVMAAAMRVARWRQRQPMHKRDWRKLYVILDEFSFMAQLTKTRIQFDGEMVTASWLASALLRGAASGDVFLVFASQRSTNDHYGDHGGDVVANIAVNNAFRSKDFAEIGRLTNDFGLPVPKHRGEFYSFTDADPAHLKAHYIQTTDPSKPKLHSGPTIADVSWARRHLVAGGLEEAEGLEAAGDAYANRHQAVDDAMMAYLTTGEVTTTAAGNKVWPGSGCLGTSTEHGDLYDAIDAQLAQIATDAGLNLADNDTPTNTASADSEDGSSREDRILLILNGTDDIDPDTGVDASFVTKVLAERLEDDCERNTVSATLSRMADRGEITRVKRGRYAAKQQTNEQTNA